MSDLKMAAFVAFMSAVFVFLFYVMPMTILCYFV